MKCLYNVKSILLILLLTITSFSYSQTVTLADAAGEAVSITGGQNNVAVFGFNLTRGTAVNLTGATVTFSVPIAGIFTNVRLFSSTDATFSFGGDTNLGSMTLGSGNDYSIAAISSAIAGAGGTFYYVVVDVDPAILSTATINATCTSTQIVTTDTEAGSATGPTYNSGNITELRVDLTQNADAGTAIGNQTGVELFDFSALSNGAQNIISPLVFTFDTDVSGILSGFDLQEGGGNIGGAEGYALTGGGTILTITGFNAVNVGTTKNFQLFANILSTATSANDFTITLATSGVTVNQGYPEAAVSFTNSVDVTALSVDLTQNADAGTAIGNQTGVELLDFSALSNGAQNVISPLVFTFDTDVSGILSGFDLQEGGGNIGGAEGYALTGGGTILTITGFNAVNVATTKNFQLFANILSSATSANDFTITLATSGVTVDQGYPESAVSFTNSVDVTALTVDLSQNADAGTAVGDQNGIELLDFSALSNGSQTIVSPLVFTFNTDISGILTGFDLQEGGGNIGGAEGYALTGGGTILTITGFNAVNVSTTKNFQLFADISSTALSSNDFTITLATSGVAVNQGYPEAAVSFTNSVDVTALTADFTQNADDATAVAGQTGVELLDFTVLSNASGTIQRIQSPLVFTFNKDITSIINNWDLRVGGADIPGSENYALSGGGTTLTVTGFTAVDITTTKNFQLLADIQSGALTTDDFIITLTNGNVAVDFGYVETFGSFTNSVDITVSNLSDITLVSGPTNPISYRSHQASTINDTDTNLSLRLAQFRIRDGGGASDADNKETSISQITLNVTGFANIRQIALTNAATDVEIAGTEQTVGGSNLITFIPSTPIRTGTDGGTFEFKVRVTWKAAVLDNDPVFVTIHNVIGEAEFSGFATGNAGGATTSGAANKTIIVTATKFIYQPGPPGTSTINANFGPITIKAVDGNPQNNRDLDYNGKLDLTISGGTGSLTGGGALTLVAGQIIVPNLQINQSGSYTLDAVDDDYTDAPDNQPDLGDPSAAITITSSASTITQPSALNLCFGGAFQTLGNIVITETDPSGFSNTGSLSIGLPSGFVFDTGTNPVLTMSNSTTSFTNIGYTGGNIVQFDYNITAPTGNNALTIAGLKIRYPGNTAPGGGNLITRSGGTATIAGVAAGTQLGTVNASLGAVPGGFGFTVTKVNAGDVDVNATETRFSQSSNPVRLVPSHGTTAGVDYTFSGPGVTLIAGQYRFNPQSLSPSPPLYDIVYSYTESTPQACQFVATKQFEVYTTNITGLLAAYCNNDNASPVLSVAAYLATFYPTFSLNRFVYWNTPGGRNTDGTINAIAGPGPVNLGNTLVASNIFDPKLPAYQPVYSSTGSVYGTIGLWIGFEITDGVSTFIIWQLIPVRPAPSPTFTFAHLASFCVDEPSVVLTGTPPNSNTITDDFFTATLVPSGTPPVGTVTSSVANPKVWSFDPGALGAGQVDITYTYRDPSTTCTATSPPIRLTVNSRPSSVVALDITDTSLESCEGEAIGTFSATVASQLTAPDQYRWYEDANLTILRGSGNTFAPPNPPANPNVSGTTNFYVTRTINGCESNKQPLTPPPALTLSVIVNSTPGPPVTNFNREYCVGDVITASDLQIGSGSFIKWYQVGNPTPLLTNVSSPNASQIATNLGISTAAANVYSFDVTQTVSLCEGLINPTRIVVTIKAKPAISISASVADPNKICTTGGIVQFTALDQSATAANGIWTGIGTSGIPNPIPTQGKLDLNPLSGLPGPYTLTYTYTNAGGCSNFGTIGINLLPVITPAVSVGNVCNGFPATIINTSSVSTGGTISQAQWTFGDGTRLDFGSGTIPAGTNGGVTTGTYFNPQQVYPNVGTFQLSGALSTTDGCVYTIPNTPVTVSPIPKIDFSWKDICRDGTSITQFTAIEKTTPTPIAISNYQWNFNVNNSLTFSSAGTGVNPTVNYDKDGKDEVELEVTTPQGCTDKITKPVYIVPSFPAITPTNSYSQTFDSGADGWVAGGLNSSWTLGTPAKTVIKGAASGANAWVTNLTGNNNQDESSWVLSRCFDFTQAAKPVFSIDIWSNTPRGVDGAVLQYNENGNIENDNNWIVVGTVGSGVNWYDDQGISNSPGNQASGDLGWTGDASSSGGKYTTYQKAIFKLDNLIGKPKVVFRIAFASAQASKDGFAFDNVFIGERSRVVLLESFTNASSSGTRVHNDFYRTFGTTSSGNAEIVKIQYHTPFPGDDALNALNTQMHNARAAFYGITSAPTARVDGDFVSGNLINWLTPYYDDRVLTPSLIKLDVSAVKTGTTVKISTSITNNSGQTVPLAGAHIFTTIVEKSVVAAPLLGNSGNSEFVYVAKQMLPTSTGLIIPNNLGAGQTYTAPDITWENNSGDAIAVFVQSVDGSNKNVFQSIMLNNPPQPDVVTGLGDLLMADKISIYPNPADDEMTIQLPAPAPQRLQLQMVDQVGRVVNEHFIREGERSKTISTRDLAGGIYLLQLGSGNASTRKKILVVHGK